MGAKPRDECDRLPVPGSVYCNIQEGLIPPPDSIIDNGHGDKGNDDQRRDYDIDGEGSNDVDEAIEE